ncbi:MAG: hypothetical protein JO035_03885 [Betaproteobacteria bacterium]|nr:hypothetical protein [Betaproteobacteria bacterium]
MQGFLALPRYSFTRAAIVYAPEESGVYGLFDGGELIYIGRASDRAEHSIRELLLKHQDGAFGDCTMKATHYTWEITIWPAARETELFARHYQVAHHEPRCQSKVKAA